jgi:hypothetical protein
MWDMACPFMVLCFEFATDHYLLSLDASLDTIEDYAHSIALQRVLRGTDDQDSEIKNLQDKFGVPFDS